MLLVSIEFFKAINSSNFYLTAENPKTYFFKTGGSPIAINSALLFKVKGPAKNIFFIHNEFYGFPF
jgi:hypothetical protein